MASHGGKRTNAGRKATQPVPKVRRDVAYEILEIINGFAKRYDDKGKVLCSGEAERWFLIYDPADGRLKWDMLRYVKECVDGKPKQRVDPMAFDPNAPLRVVVEHIGRRPQI